LAATASVVFSLALDIPATAYGGIPMAKEGIVPESYDNLHVGIVELLIAARSAAVKNVNSIMTGTY
jgi:hypothetical protein